MVALSPIPALGDIKIIFQDNFLAFPIPSQQTPKIGFFLCNFAKTAAKILQQNKIWLQILFILWRFVAKNYGHGLMAILGLWAWRLVATPWRFFMRYNV